MRAKARAVGRPIAIALFGLFIASLAPPARAGDAAIRVLPRPATIETQACTFLRSRALTVAAGTDSGALDIVAERFRALGIPPLALVANGVQTDVTVRPGAGGPQSYRLRIDARGVAIEAPDADGAFYAFTTLAQLARRAPGGGTVLPCARIADAPALRWRILSDDVSRGPLPTQRYFEERIRTIAAFKMNGYSPYMEHVYLDPQHPLPAPAHGITASELRALDRYARRFHVALILEQQTFAHMHNTLRWERYASLAELPHGYLLTPANPQGRAYVADLIRSELAAVPHPPFFHVGSDEPLDLGRGAAGDLVKSSGEAQVFAQHVLDTIALLPAGTRPLIWDDAVQANPAIFARLPKSVVFVNWHYGAEKTFAPYIDRIAKAGFDQMVAPGADNWNELFPDIDVAVRNIATFVGEGKAAHVLGLFQTVWHDDGETLYESTWYPVLYAATGAWERDAVAQDRFARDFPLAFFATDDARYASDIEALAHARTLLRPAAEGANGNYLFWADPLDPAVHKRMALVDVAALRLTAERAIEHLRTAPAPPLHAAAAAAMEYAARRYDALGRSAQIATEARAYYDDARANAGKNDNYTGRGLNVAKYLFWELRDTALSLEPVARSTWEHESTSDAEAAVLERYHMAAQRAIARADALNRIAVEVYPQAHALPPFDDAVRPAPPGN